MIEHRYSDKIISPAQDNAIVRWQLAREPAVSSSQSVREDLIA